MPVRKEGRVIGPGCSFIVAPHWHFSLSIVSSLRFPFAPNPARTREDFSLKQTQRSIQPRLRAIGPQSGHSSSRRRPNKDGQPANMVKTRVAVALIGYRAGYVQERHSGIYRQRMKKIVVCFQTAVRGPDSDYGEGLGLRSRVLCRRDDLGRSGRFVNFEFHRRVYAYFRRACIGGSRRLGSIAGRSDRQKSIVEKPTEDNSALATDLFRAARMADGLSTPCLFVRRGGGRTSSRHTRWAADNELSSIGI